MRNTRGEEILIQLNRSSLEFNFPILDNGYLYPAGTKLTAYRDDERWALVIELIGYNYRGGGHNGISNCLHIYGNCLSFSPGIQNENFIFPTSDAKCSTFDSEEYFYLNPACEKFLLRQEAQMIIHDRKKYLAAGINLQDEDRINAFEFLRLLDGIYHHKLVATESEISERIPADISRVLELHEWFHPDIINGELPSDNEAFIQIAKVLETGNSEFYNPSRKANTHWSNWPLGGTL